MDWAAILKRHLEWINNSWISLGWRCYTVVTGEPAAALKIKRYSCCQGRRYRQTLIHQQESTHNLGTAITFTITCWFQRLMSWQPPCARKEMEAAVTISCLWLAGKRESAMWPRGVSTVNLAWVLRLQDWRWREKTHASSPSTSGKTYEKTSVIQTRPEQFDVFWWLAVTRI